MAETERAPEPDDGAEREILLGRLEFHRDALAATNWARGTGGRFAGRRTS